MNKENLRNLYLDKRNNMDIKLSKSFDSKIFKTFIKSSFYKSSNHIMSFVSFKSEVDTHRIIKNTIKDKKNIYVPITIPNTKSLKVSKLSSFKELEVGYYDILTPREKFINLYDPNILDLILVPGIIFSEDGYRIGFGGGYYDRFFSNIDDKIIKIGLCYDFQIKNNIPINDYDIPVNYIITEKRIINC